MYYIDEDSLNPRTLAKTYSIWSADWKRVFNIELAPEQYKKFISKKKKVQKVNWMQILAQSDEDAKTGQYATEVKTIKELKP